MNEEYLFNALEHVDADLIEEAETAPRRKNAWRSWALAAACFCLVVGGVYLLKRPAAPAPEIPAEQPGPAASDDMPEPGGLSEEPPGPMTDEELAVNDAQRWSETMTAADYFKNNTEFPDTPSEEACLVMPPYSARISLDSERAALEAEGILPEMPDHPEQDFSAEYNGDGSLYKVRFHWMRRDEQGVENYSDLIMIAAPVQWSELLDDIRAYRAQAPVTVTEHNGILITATGGEGWNKTLSWWGEGGFYRIDGSWNDSFEDMVALLDWFWEHPFDLSPYAHAPAELMRFADRSEYPDVFRDEIPDFAALGYETESERLSFASKTDFSDAETPVGFEGVYTRGHIRARWTISAGADANAWADCLGRPREVTREALDKAAAEELFAPGCDFYAALFLDGDVPRMGYLRLESCTLDDVWEIIQTLVH